MRSSQITALRINKIKSYYYDETVSEFFNALLMICQSFQKICTKNILSLLLLMLTYCTAVPVPHIPVSPDSHKNSVKMSSLVRLYVMTLERVYWQPEGKAFEWIGVWTIPVKLNSPSFRAHHLIVLNDSIKLL